MHPEITARRINSIYVDGAYTDAAKHGGWAYVICHSDGSVTEAGGAVADTNAQRMEMYALIQALHHIVQSADRKGKIHIFSDWKYLIVQIEKDLKVWEQNGFVSSKGSPVNVDLWKEISRLLAIMRDRQIDLTMRYIPAHQGIFFNHVCDRIAKAFSRKRYFYQDLNASPARKQNNAAAA